MYNFFKMKADIINRHLDLEVETGGDIRFSRLQE